MAFELSKKIGELVCSRLQGEEDTAPDFANLEYPTWLPMMKFEIHQYKVQSFGQVMTMDTKMMGGIMKLSTIVFTPNSGVNMPFLLIDTMQMIGGKNLAYVEYYDMTNGAAVLPQSENYKERFADIPDYEETPAWYVSERTPYSLIKGGKGVDKEELDQMVLYCIDCYLEAFNSAEVNPENVARLKEFQSKMIELGNPSTNTMTKVLGSREAADYFFEKIVMPVPEIDIIANCEESEKETV